MKFYITFFLLVISAGLFAQRGKLPVDSLYAQHLPPIHYNYKNCQFSIKPGKWVTHSGKITLPVKTTLYNHSNDTLKYGVITCWYEYYWVDNKLFDIEGANYGCDKNILVYHEVLPHKSASFTVNLVKKSVSFPVKVKMSFRLVLQREQTIIEGIEVMKDGSIMKIPDSDLVSRTHILWSETVKI